MPFKPIFTLLALSALTYALPTNLTSNFSSSIPGTLDGSGLLERSTGDLTGGILRRNPPDWGKLDPADNALIHKYENEGRKWFSRLLVLKLDPPGAEGPGGVANPMNFNSFNSFVSGKLGDDPTGQGWQRAALWTNSIHRQWQGVQNSAQMEGSFDPIQPILESLKVGKNSQAEWDNERNVNGAVYPNGANLGYSYYQNIDYQLQIRKGRYQGEEMAATGAFYHNWFNIADGVIVVSRGISPRKIAPNRPQDKLPMHRYWSDMVYVTWNRMHMDTHNGPSDVVPTGGWKKILGNAYRAINHRNMEQMLGLLNWIVVEGIPVETNNPEVHNNVHRIIKRCLQERRGNTNIPRFPDTEKFKMGHWCFYALLATDGSSGITYFLGQHKGPDMLGHKLLDEVTITKGQYTNAEYLEFSENPTLLWHVVDYSDIAVAEMIQRERAYQGQKGNLGEMPFWDVPT